MTDQGDTGAPTEGTGPLLEPSAVAETLGVSLATVKRLTASGALPHVRVTQRRPRYLTDDITRFIEARRQTAAEGKTGYDGQPVSGSCGTTSVGGGGGDAKPVH
jgi:excisionase family DNA binding protein